MEPSSWFAEPLPKQFEGFSEVLPLTKHGVSTLNEFRKSEVRLQHVDWLKKIGLSKDEIELYQDNETGRVGQRNIESTILKIRLQSIYQKISCSTEAMSVSTNEEEQPSTATILVEKLHNVPLKTYPKGHPMNDIEDLEHNLFSHLKPEEQIPPVNKRRKLLRRLQRKEERLLVSEVHQPYSVKSINKEVIPGSLWDVKEMPQKSNTSEEKCTGKKGKFIGPKKPTMYTVKNNKIVRLEPLDKGIHNCENYQAVDIVMPVNVAEERLLEGTKMCVDDIKKIERFKDYEPGIPSKVLYLKNIASNVSQEQLQVLFLQFVQDNGGPIDVRLMTGRMRGQAFVAFENAEVSIRALEEVNGTIVGGRPIIVQFGRQSNRIQDEDNR